MSSQKRVWSPSSLRYMYKEVVKQLGEYDPGTWNGMPSKKRGHHLNGSQVDTVFEDIRLKLIAKFPDLKPPKSSGALKQQVAWGTTSQAKQNLKIVRENRMAAYAEGFMGMSDICDLERAGKEKARQQKGT